jgi:LPPG:FO 2-phospho-L-lactate transferase
MKVVALAGGIGASKFLTGLVEVLPAEEITIIVNTGDDFHWMGLYICPDLDTVTYTLAGLANPETGWGIRGDTFHGLERLQTLGCDTWFKLGDRDLATHIYRSQKIREGQTLAEVTGDIARQNGLRSSILPMTNNQVPTEIQTDQGILPFQEYFVRRRCQPRVQAFLFRTIENALPAPGVLEIVRSADAILVCPSNPFISIGPILAVPGIRDALHETDAKVVAITPIIAGQAIKGPTARMLGELGHEVSAVSVARMYRDFLDIFVLDQSDAALVPQVEKLGMEVRLAETLMTEHRSKIDLARNVIRMV